MAGSVGALEHLDVYENPSRFVVVGRRRVDGGAASALGYQLLVVASAKKRTTCALRGLFVSQHASTDSMVHAEVLLLRSCCTFW